MYIAKTCCVTRLWIIMMVVVICYVRADRTVRAEDNPCEGQPNGSYHRHPLGCKYFILCIRGNVNTGVCPNGLAFNPNKPPCDLASTVGCVDDVATTTTSTTTRPTTSPTTTTTTTSTTTTTTMPPTTSTTTTSMPTTTPTTTASTTTTPTTTTSTTTSSTTPTTTITTTTVAPTTTTVAPTTTTASTTTTALPTTTSAPTTTTTFTPIVNTPTTTTTPQFQFPQISEPLISCPIEDDPMTVKFVSSNEDCSKYYICYHNQPVEMTCADDLHWNHRTQKCDLRDRAECHITATPASYPVCQRDSIGLYPHPFKCELFLYCYHGHMTVQQCPFYYHWDVELQSCELKSVAKCGSRTNFVVDDWPSVSSTNRWNRGQY